MVGFSMNCTDTPMIRDTVRQEDFFISGSITDTVAEFYNPALIGEGPLVPSQDLDSTPKIASEVRRRYTFPVP